VSSSTQEAPAVSFSSFVVSLATSAMTHLGQGPSPSIDLAMARQTIDLLAVLQEKTKGNLDAEESKLLETVLHETRSKYVEQAKG
jgi:hypothetical protein